MATDKPVVEIDEYEAAIEHFDAAHGMTMRGSPTAVLGLLGPTRHYHAYLHRTGPQNHTHRPEALDPPASGPPPRTSP